MEGGSSRATELLEAEAVKWKRDANEARKASEETQEELALMEEEVMRWKRDAEEARHASCSMASASRLRLPLPPRRQGPPEEKLAHAVVELHACRQAMHSISVASFPTGIVRIDALAAAAAAASSHSSL
ncbi:hypothetical protein OC835_007800, partial [Tilletia horrida]